MNEPLKSTIVFFFALVFIVLVAYWLGGRHANDYIAGLPLALVEDEQVLMMEGDSCIAMMGELLYFRMTEAGENKYHSQELCTAMWNYQAEKLRLIL